MTPAGRRNLEDALKRARQGVEAARRRIGELENAHGQLAYAEQTVKELEADLAEADEEDAS